VKLSVKSDYAARAVLALARQHASGQSQRIEDLAVQQGIPAGYLVQILIELKSRKLVRSVRGKAGGYLLAKAPGDITLGDVLHCVHGQVFDTPALSDANCPPELRRAWERLRTSIEAAAGSINFQQILDDSAEKEKMYYI
jgi:Rrf2 family transcriptional regulator, cysteine metabolism repressor